MFNFISARWQALKTKYKKFFPFLFTFIFCFSPLSVKAAEVSPDAQNDWFLLPFNELGDIVGTFDETQGTFYGTGSGNTRYPQFEVGINHSSVLPLLQNGHRYLIYGTLSLASTNNTASPSSLSLYEFINDRTQSYMWSNNAIEKHVDYNRDTYTVSGIYSFTMSEDIFLNTGGALVWEQTETIVFNGRCSWAFYALDVTDNTESEVNQIVAAINNQTDFIVNGDDSTSGIVSQFQSNLNEFNSVINQFDDIENGFISDFTSSNDEIKSTLSDYQFTGNLLTCANWVTDRYMDFFDNSGDFKQYFIYPLIMGIALFFIGRGQVILGNLYRKPYDNSTHTITTGYTERYSDGTKRVETYSRTIGRGGKLRK